VAQTIVPATGEHSYVDGKCVDCGHDCNHVSDNGVIEDITEPTCGTDGSQTIVYKCTICGITLSEHDETLPATNKHEGGETVIENYVEPGCETWGSYEEVVYCKVCDVELNRTTGGVIKPTGHNMQSNNDYKAPTCTEAGQYESFYCANGCGHTTGGGIIPDLGHEYGPIEIENVDEATCESNGSHDEVQYCTVCDEELSRETITDLATGHLEGESVIENSYESSCTEHGSYDTVWYCQYCDTELQRTTTTLELAPHNLVTVNENEKEADCTNWGSYDAVVKCSVCGAESERHTELTDKPLGHNYIGDMNDIPPTCEEDGKEETQTCTRCDDKIGGAIIPATGHTSDSGTSETVDSTCTTHGYTKTVWKCISCGTVLEESTDELELAPHNLTTVVENEVAATCISMGSYDEVVKCSVCGAESERHTEYTDKDPNNHTGVDGCQCEDCGDDWHNYKENDDAVEPTCGQDGRTASKTCTACGATVAGTTIPATGNHSYFEGTCEVCDHVCTHDNYNPEHDEVCPDCDEYVINN
jgi:hypothetical protein